MNSYFHQQYVDIHKAVTKGERFERKFNSITEVDKLKDNNLELIIKFYE